MRHAYLVVALASALAACTVVGPDYERPQLDVPSAWRVDYPQAAELANARWWERFDDAALNDLIESALR
ncbi:MAG: hypothetical protein AMJ64_14835, partial [Betaproteobacteria bacterium SG8_39]